MKGLNTLLFISLLSGQVLAQETQETEIDKRNGFKDIKLATPVDSIKGAKFKKDFKEKEHPAKVFTIEHPDYSTIGEVKIDRIEVKTYKNLIYEILVITEKDERLMKGMEKALGKPDYNVRDESYNWVGKKASLKFKAHSKSQLELLYNSHVMHTMMRNDKDKKIDAIADDF
jgi:hypothetical protein